MALRIAGSHRRHSALVPTLGGAAIVATVVLANCWSMLHSAPDLAQMDPLERLQALHADLGVLPGHSVLPGHGVLPANALADALPGALAGAGRSDAVTGGAPEPLRMAVPLPGGATSPAAALTRSWIVQPGEGLTAALARLYVHGQAARDVLTAYESLRNPQKLQAGWRLWARFTSAGVMDAGALVSVVVAPASGEGLTIERDEDGGFRAREGGLPGTVVRQALRCGIVDTLEASLRRCGEGESLAALVQGILGERLLTPIEPRTGDELRIVFDKLMDGDHLVRYHRIAALEYRSAQLELAVDPAGPGAKGRLLAVHFANQRGQAGYFDAEGRSIEPLLLRQPLRVGRTTSGYGMRLHPILHRMKAHYGVDFAAPRGTPVWAAGDGQLLTAARTGAAGNLVRIRHESGYVTEYMHLQRFATGLQAGGRVQKGQLIGYVGSTGRSTGPHLHFGVRHNGQYLDPMSLGKVGELPIPARDRKAYDQHARELRELLDALDGNGRPGDAS